MESANYKTALLNMIEKPAFLAVNGTVSIVNTAAAQMQISTGTSLTTLLADNTSAYESMENGCLFLTLNVHAIPCPAAVVRTDAGDIFTLRNQGEDIRLQAMALAAQQLRVPLSNVMTVAQQLFPALSEEDDQKTKVGQLSRGLFQLLRLISNMADTQRYSAPDTLHMEHVEFSSLFDEIAEKSAALLDGSGRRLAYTGLKETIVGMGCPEALERAIYNLISNGIKFSEKGTDLHLSVKRQADMLLITAENRGCSIEPGILSTIFTRYQREPGIEDGRHGIGLGLTLVRCTAAAHGGTVLVQEPREGGIRITMTIKLRMDKISHLHSPILPISDYAGGWDHGLTELSEALAASVYENEI